MCDVVARQESPLLFMTCTVDIGPKHEGVLHDPRFVSGFCPRAVGDLYMVSLFRSLLRSLMQELMAHVLCVLLKY